MTAQLTVIRWRDIPAQVVAKDGRKAAKFQLEARFQEAIDVAASRAGLIGSDEYLTEWQRDSRTCGDDLQAEVDAEVGRIEAAHPDDVLAALARAGGVRE